MHEAAWKTAAWKLPMLYWWNRLYRRVHSLVGGCTSPTTQHWSTDTIQDVLFTMITWVSNVSIVLVTSSYLLFTLDMRTVYMLSSHSNLTSLFLWKEGQLLRSAGSYVLLFLSENVHRFPTRTLNAKQCRKAAAQVFSNDGRCTHQKR